MKAAYSWLTGLVFLCLLLTGLVAGWLYVLASDNLPNGRLATFLPWPVACTMRGCVNTQQWERQQQIAERFAASVQTEAASPEELLTTMVRRHCLAQAFLASPVTPADARRYREEILHFKDEAKLQEVAGLTFAEYDKLVIMPFLQQAALQQQRKVETVDELYASLAQERFVLVLPFHYRWDKEKGRVVSRD